MKITLYGLILLIVLIGVAVYAVLHQPSMGRLPTGERLKKVQASPNYRDGAFQNIQPTADLTNGATQWSILRDSLSNPNQRTSPAHVLPSVKTDLKQLPKDKNVLIWFGHASYFMQIDGKTYLIDPVLSGRASPIPFTVTAFKGTDIYTVDDLPEIDYLLITHDHWDHIDYPVIKKLQPKVKRIITGLGTGEHLASWGYDEGIITELDWHEQIQLHDGTTLTALPARHFSGRGFKRNQALWLSLALHTPSTRIYMSGDSGYGEHFKTIGAQHGPFDLAILENGQYNKSWEFIHSLPEQTAVAAREISAAAILPVHWGKFKLSLHDWDEPIERLITARQPSDPDLLTPMIGEPVWIGQKQTFSAWWRDVKP